MSTSLLYHAFGIVGYKYVATRYTRGKVIFKIQQKDRYLRCPVCGSKKVVKKGTITRMFRLLPIGSRQVWAQGKIQRVKCMACNIVRQVKVRFADNRKSYSRRFERYALALCQHMTMKDVADHLGVSWDVVKEIQKRHLNARFSRPKLKGLKCIAIDEISISKGHRYLTVVLDLKKGVVVFVGDGKGTEALEPFWRRLRRSGATIEAVAIDMSKAYIAAVRENLPNAVMVFDRFHVVKLFNDKLSNFRRTLYHQIKDEGKKKVLKGTRWLLLKSPENLDEDRKEHQRLQEALELNRPLATAYYMKEEIRRLWSFRTKGSASEFLEDWISRARASGIPMLSSLAKTLENYKEGILAYYDYPISTGPLEGTNNKIKTMKRQAYGFRDHEFFKLNIMASHLSRYALVG